MSPTKPAIGAPIAMASTAATRSLFVCIGEPCQCVARMSEAKSGAILLPVTPGYRFAHPGSGQLNESTVIQLAQHPSQIDFRVSGLKAAFSAAWDRL